MGLDLNVFSATSHYLQRRRGEGRARAFSIGLFAPDRGRIDVGRRVGGPAGGGLSDVAHLDVDLEIAAILIAGRPVVF